MSQSMAQELVTLPTSRTSAQNGLYPTSERVGEIQLICFDQCDAENPYNWSKVGLLILFFDLQVIVLLQFKTYTN